MNTHPTRVSRSKSFGKCIVISVVALLLMLGGTLRADLQLQSYSPHKHDRYYDGTDPVRAFIGEAFDFSGVGKAGLRWAVMISPTYFLTAAHADPMDDGATTLTFYEGNDLAGTSRTYSIDTDFSFQTSYGAASSDLLLGRLTAPMPEADEIAFYPVLLRSFKSTYKAYKDEEIYVYGQENRVGRNTIDIVLPVPTAGGTTISMQYDFDDPGGVGDDEAYLIVKDSGGPSFVVVNGQLALVGIHLYHSHDVGVNGSYSGDSFVPYYIDQLNANMGDESVTIVPEPMTVSLLALGGAAVLARRRRRR